MKERTELREYWARKAAEHREKVKRMEEEDAEELWKAEQDREKANGVSEQAPHDSSGLEKSIRPTIEKQLNTITSDNL